MQEREKMASQKKNGKKKAASWVLIVFFLSFGLSMLMSWSSSAALADAGIAVAALTVLLLVAIGIITDIIGMAVASADQPPFVAMAAKKLPGAKQALWLIKNAAKVSSVCNDVAGDICGVVSGAAGTTLSLRIAEMQGVGSTFYIGIVVAGFIAALTVGGKALGKGFAIRRSREIVFFVGRCLTLFKK